MSCNRRTNFCLLHNMHINSNAWSRITFIMKSDSITKCCSMYWHNIFTRLNYNMYTIRRISVVAKLSVALELLQQAIQLQIKSRNLIRFLFCRSPQTVRLYFAIYTVLFFCLFSHLICQGF